ncbi:hypothetical protein KO506_04840 [Polaribacter vadi]|jgi:hypothetical protein|uniref:hypothetical protein n=1 Tax=Polaribacter TaxID=52959 RepID=UPI001C08C4FB|nr:MULTISPECIES: hypothetical protein [Polaribacter]MBU3010715.1 hypothetical protein [Polaribacter vadi]MDO6740526.1 hypothetical protein [Polaribacter sp. 1_MG-2023]
MKKGILITIFGILLVGIFYFGIELYEFAEGVKKDIPKNIENFQNNRKLEIIKKEKKQKLDTLNIDNFNLLFFHPNEKEFEELLIEYKSESEGLYEADSDFGFYINKVFDSISKTDLKIKIVTERIIEYSTKDGIKYLDRLKNKEHQYGIIFNNLNCEPKIEFGIMTDIGIYKKLSQFNKNCK